MARASAEAFFEREVERALSLLDKRADLSAPLVDALADPGGAVRSLKALAAGGSAEGTSWRILRAAPELGAASAGYGPAPAAPLWVKIERGSADVAIASLRAPAEDGKDAKGDGPPARARARSVEVVAEERPCCDAPSCSVKRTHASAWLVLDAPGGDGGRGGDARRGEGEGRRLLVAEAWDVARAQAVGAARAVGSALARAMGVPLTMGAGAGAEEGGGADEQASADDPGDGAEGAPLAAGLVARWAIRSEGDRIVLRDYASRGPHDTARRTLFIGLGLLALALGLWALFAKSVTAGEQGLSVALGAVAALASLTAYAFLGVGRFAARYAAESSPLVAMGRDRVIVAPWVSRHGSVDLRPEGRLGAAIPIGEVRGVFVRDRGGRKVVELDTDHGVIDALACDRDDVAELFCRALTRSINEVRHPSAGASARQRARARAAAAS